MPGKIISDAEMEALERQSAPQGQIPVISDAEMQRLEQKDAAPSSNVLEAGVRGGLNALTLGHVDEFAGALKSPSGALKKLQGKDDEDTKAYAAERDHYRDVYDKAREEHPTAYGLGGLGGTIIGPGKILKGLRGVKAAAAAAGLGGAIGEGESKGKTAEEVGKDAALGTALGGAAQVAGEKVLEPTLKVVGKTLNPVADYIARKAGYGAFKIPEGTTVRYLRNPEQINEAAPLRDAAESLPALAASAKSTSADFSRQAREALSAERQGSGGVPVEKVLGILDEAAKKHPGVKTLRDEVEQAYLSRLGNVDQTGAGNMTEREARDVVDRLKDYADFSQTLPESHTSAANAAHGKINEILHSQNPAYEQLMGDSAANAQARTRLIKKFGLERDTTAPTGYSTTDRTVTAAKDLARADKADRSQVLNDVSALGHPDVRAAIQASLDKAALSKDATQGSRMVNLGRSIGGVAGKPGEAIGGAMGAVADRLGTTGFKKGLDVKNYINRKTTAKSVSSAIAQRSAAGYVRQQTDRRSQERLKAQQQQGQGEQ